MAGARKGNHVRTREVRGESAGKGSALFHLLRDCLFAGLRITLYSPEMSLDKKLYSASEQLKRPKVDFEVFFSFGHPDAEL